MKKLMSVAVVLLLVVGLVVGCGGGDDSSDSAGFSTDLANTFEGKFFKIGYPEGWEVTEEPSSVTIQPIPKDDENEEEFNFDMTAVTIQDSKSPDSKRGKVQGILDGMMEEAGDEAAGMFDLEASDFAGEKALKMEITFLVVMESYIIPMNDWTITVGMIGNNKEAKEILESFFITDPNYSGSTDAIEDWDLDNDEKPVFDDDWDLDDDEEETEDDDDFSLFDTPEGAYKGEYFTINQPEGFVVEDEDPNEVIFTGADFTIMIACEKEEGYIWGDIDMLKEELKEEIESGEVSNVEDIEIGVNSAIWMEDDAENMIMIGIPMTDWFVAIMVTDFEGDDIKAEIKKMVMTFDVTDMFYLW